MEMLRSREKELLDEIAKLKAEKDAAYGAALRMVNRVVLCMEGLPVQYKDQILEEIWKK